VNRKITFNVSEELYLRSKGMPWGARSHVLRALLDRALTRGEQHGSLYYGALIDGDFDITFFERNSFKLSGEQE